MREDKTSYDASSGESVEQPSQMDSSASAPETSSGQQTPLRTSDGKYKWFRCTKCGLKLKKIYIYGAWTCLSLQGVIIRKAKVPCHRCKTMSEFHADPVSAYKLRLVNLGK